MRPAREPAATPAPGVNVPLRLQLDLSGDETAEDGAAHPHSPAAEALAGVESLSDKQLAAFRKAVHLEPEDPDYPYILGQALAEAGRHAEALPVLEQAVRLRSEDPSYHEALGSTLWKLERYEEALTAFQAAVRLKPDEVRALNGAGSALTALGRAEEAVEIYRQALRLQHAQADLSNNLAVALWRWGKCGEAVRVFRRAVRLGPSSGYIHRNLALALAGLGQHDRALEGLRQVVRLRPNDAEAQLDLGDALYGLGRQAEAEAAYEQALHLDPSAAGRASTREARRQLLLGRLREELKGPARPLESVASLVWGGVFGVAHAAHALITASGKLGGAIGLLLLGALGYASWHAAPPYVAHYLLHDDVVQAARAATADDMDVRDRLMHAVRARGLDRFVEETSCGVSTREKWRTISCEYDVPVEILPGLTRKLHFRIRVEEPYLFTDEKRFY